MINLQTTISGLELTLTTLAEISSLITQLDERLAQLSPELPQIASGQISTGGLAEMLATYQQAFAAIEAAGRAAEALGISGDLDATRVARKTQAPTEPKTVNPTPVVQNTVEETPAPIIEAQPEPPVAQKEVVVQQVVSQPQADEPVAPAISKPISEVLDGQEIQRPTHVAPKGKQIGSAAELSKPLKPIEMPAIDHQVGPMICNGSNVIYAHGPELKKYWPGTSTAHASLPSLIPNDPWRLHVVDTNVFCVADEAVSVAELGDLHVASTFFGKFVAQANTATSWVGVRDDNGVLSVMFRDKKGKAVSSEVKLGQFTSENVFLETAGECAFIALGCGDVFRVEGTTAEHIITAEKDVEIVGLTVDKHALLITHRSAKGVWLTMVDHRGKPALQSAIVAKSISHQPVLLEDQIFLFDDANSEVVALSLDTLQELGRNSIPEITSVARMLAIADESGATLAIMAQAAESRPSGVYLHATSSGVTHKICQLSAVKAELAYADGHIVVSSTSSMQNLIQVFNIYSPALAMAA